MKRSRSELLSLAIVYHRRMLSEEHKADRIVSATGRDCCLAAAVNRELSDEEVAQILAQFGQKPL